jgi:DNA-binding winged helix-turn-helix (wHTH) protein
MAANYKIGSFRLDADALIVFRGADAIALGRRAVMLLRTMVEQPGVPISKEGLIGAAWPGLAVEESNLTVQIAALRRIFSQEDGGDRWIETLPRRGYRFVGPLLRTDEEIPLSPLPSAGAALAAASPIRAAEAERRQLLVMSCELLGASGVDLELEELGEVIRAFHDAVAITADGFHGSVGKHVGNTVLVYFGYPAAHEHDAELAVRAGLELCTAVKTLVPGKGLSLRCRVGIATGLVIVGELIEASAADKGGIVGEAPNLASRLQMMALADMVVVENTTRHLIGNLFHCREIGPIGPNPTPEPLAWHVLGPSAVESRFEALRSAALTPLIGREEEIELLARRWTQAKQGEGKVVLLSGEPGIGKSRIALTQQDALQGEPHVKLRYSCSPHHINSALFPFVSQLEQALAFNGDESEVEKLARLEALLTAPARRIEHSVSTLAGLLSLPAGNDPAFPDTTPDKRKEHLFAILLAQLEGLCAQHPALIVFEDVHWLDPTSRELLSLIIERAPSLRLLAIVTFRPEFNPPWTGEAHVTAMLLGRLGQRERAALVGRIAGDKKLPHWAVDQIADRTDGIPLFLEELTKAVLETGTDASEIGKVMSTTSSASLAVPATLHASLTARLDRVGSARDIAQTGAAIGREFSYELLAAVAHRSEDELRSGLERLTETGLLFCRGSPPHAVYQFKHALIQDAAYGMLLKDRRRQLHTSIAAALEKHFPALAQAQPELIAYHYTKAGCGSQAIDFWLKAGLLANERSANEEAVKHLTAALELLGTIKSEEHRSRLELQLRSTLAPALIAARGYGSAETVATYERARTLIHATKNFSTQARVLAGLYAVYITRAEYAKALDVADECLKSAEQRSDPAALCVAHRLVAVSHNIGGDFPAAHRHAARAWACYDYSAHSPLAWHHAQDIGVAAGSFLAIALVHLCRFEEAAKLTTDVLDLSYRLGHHNTIGYAHCCAAALPAFFARDFPKLRHHASEMQAFGRQHNLPQWISWGACLEAPALAAAGEFKRAAELMETALLLRKKINNNYAMRLIFTGAVEIHLRSGSARKALALIDDLLDTAANTYERWTNAELWRLKGEALLAAEGTSATDIAEASFREAMSIAETQGSRMLLQRAATSLARLTADRALCGVAAP